MTEVSSSITINRATHTSSIAFVFDDSIPGVTFAFSGDTGDFTLDGLGMPLTMTLDNIAEQLGELSFWLSSTTESFGLTAASSALSSFPNHSIEHSLDASKAKPVGVVLRINGLKLIDADWQAAGSIVTVKPRVAAVVDISGIHLFIDAYLHFVRMASSLL